MLGFLGTVTGMIRAFYDMSMAGNNIDIELLSAGIYEADRMSGVRMSADNPVTEALYKTLLAGDNAHHCQHTHKADGQIPFLF